MLFKYLLIKSNYALESFETPRRRSTSVAGTPQDERTITNLNLIQYSNSWIP